MDDWFQDPKSTTNSPHDFWYRNMRILEIPSQRFGRCFSHCVVRELLKSCCIGSANPNGEDIGMRLADEDDFEHPRYIWVLKGDYTTF